MNEYNNIIITQTEFNNFLGLIVVVLAILFIWSAIWKGLALWKSARRGNVIWFIIFLLVNTVGILEIIYIFLIARRKPEEININGGLQNAQSSTMDNSKQDQTLSN